MEKKKLLLVAISVGMVLIILISIPLVLINQNTTSSRDMVSTVRIDLDEPMVTDSEEIPAIDSIIEITPETEPRVQITSPDPAQPSGSGALRPADVPRVTINIPAPRTVAVPDARTITPVPRSPQGASPAPQRPAAPAALPAPVTTPPVVAAPVPAAPVVQNPETATPAITQAVPSVSQAGTQTNYWVQTGAFSTQTRAEGVKDSLHERGITSVIDNPEINGRTLYRVRVGPYMNETEAKWWLTLVQSIDGFVDSQVRQSQVVIQ